MSEVEAVEATTSSDERAEEPVQSSAVTVTSTSNADGHLNLQLLITDGKNPRGIPSAKFIVSCKIALLNQIVVYIIIYVCLNILTSYILYYNQENVEDFLKITSANAETAIGAFNELYQKYKYMESSFEKNKQIYKSKIPDIEQTLETIRLMKKKQENDEEMLTYYSLCDTIYTKAKVINNIFNHYNHLNNSLIYSYYIKLILIYLCIILYLSC